MNVPVARHSTVLLLAAFVTVYTALEVASYRQLSATWDEPIHLAAGYAALSRSDYRIDPSHPPFMRMWAAIPLIVLRPTFDWAEVDRASASEWAPEGNPYDAARRFLYEHNDADRLLTASRFMIVVWGLVLGVLLFAWTREWLGVAPAVIVLACYTIAPNLAAHASLVTTDAGVTCFFFGAIYCLWRLTRQVTALNVAGFTAACALAVATKYSALILGPIVGLLLIIAVRSASAITVRVAVKLCVLLIVATMGTIWLVYGLHYAPGPDQGWLFKFQDTGLAQRAPELSSIVSWIDDRRLLPNAFTQGLLYNVASQINVSFLAGEYSATGWWYYFPLAFLLKTPLPMVALLAIGLWTLIARRSRFGMATTAFVILPPAVYLGVAMMSTFNIGIRHVLPVFPFVLLLVGVAAQAMIGSRRLAPRLVLAALGVFWVARFVAVYPHTLAFFSQAIGGSSHGFRYLSDSNLDWGQDLKALKRWMDRNAVRQINLAYFGQAVPSYYQIDCTYLPGSPNFAAGSIARPRLPGFVAISTTVLSGPYLDPAWRLFYRAFESRPPEAEIGHSIRVYWVDEWPEPDAAGSGTVEVHRELADRLTYGLGWLDHGLLHYERYLTERPGDAGALISAGQVLAATGRRGEALDSVRKAVSIEPHNPLARRILAAMLATSGNAGEAEVHARYAVEIAPRDPLARDVLGQILAMQGQLDRAVEQFEVAVRLDARLLEARDHLARARSQVRR